MATLTPDQALQLLEAVKQENKPEKIFAACNTVAMAAAEWAAQSRRRDETLRLQIADLNDRFQKLVKAVNMMARGGGETAAETVAAEAAAAPAAPAASTGGRVHADGTPMSDEEAAIEDMMDAATAGQSPHPGVGGGASAPAPAPAAAAPTAPTPPLGKITPVKVPAGGNSQQQLKA